MKREILLKILYTKFSTVNLKSVKILISHSIPEDFFLVSVHIFICFLIFRPKVLNYICSGHFYKNIYFDIFDIENAIKKSYGLF